MSDYSIATSNSTRPERTHLRQLPRDLMAWNGINRDQQRKRWEKKRARGMAAERSSSEKVDSWQGNGRKVRRRVIVSDIIKARAVQVRIRILNF